MHSASKCATDELTEKELLAFLTITSRRMSTTSCLVGMPFGEALGGEKRAMVMWLQHDHGRRVAFMGEVWHDHGGGVA